MTIRPLAITEGDYGHLLDALTQKALTTRSYLVSYDDVATGPAPSDLCCEVHRTRFERRQDERDALVERHAEVADLTQRIEDVQPGLVLTRDQLNAWAGRELEVEEIDRLAAAIGHSSVPEAIATIVSSFED